jgi:hypothetical protein
MFGFIKKIIKIVLIAKIISFLLKIFVKRTK